ncbi:MAG: hypothetical protein HXK94_002790 [Candidatus Nanogingivalaceae bacterium]|nr:MAG: hypothetical protein HXK94_002790 [Candidatus Nanogingivalaceae bacterium]
MSTNNIKKFAKYGLVLVAAITIATAAQAQQGTMQKVYADETTTQFTADNSRMFYLKYTLSDQPEITWMQGAVVGPNGYTVQAPDDVDGYPYYTITGPQGNQYSVGDKITTEEPGLFGHTNPEDDALNYLYYKTDPNASTSEAPAPSTSPSTSEAANKDHAVEKPSQKADDKTTATDKAKNATDKKTDSKKAKDQVKTEKSKGATVAAKDDSTSKKAEASAPAEQAKAVKANTNANSQDNIVKEADGTVDTAAVHNDNNGGAILTMLGLVSAAFIGLFKNKKEEK